MTGNSEITMGYREAIQNVTLKVRFSGARRFRICVWLAVRLIHLAAFVLGPKADIDVDLRHAA